MLAASWPPPVPMLAVGALLAPLACWGRRRALFWVAVGAGGLVLGAVRMRSVIDPALPPDHVARLPLPLQTTVVGRVVSAPEARDERVVLVIEAEAVGRGAARRPTCGLVRLTIRRPARRWRWGDRLGA